MAHTKREKNPNRIVAIAFPYGGISIQVASAVRACLLQCVLKRIVTAYGFSGFVLLRSYEPNGFAHGLEQGA